MKPKKKPLTCLAAVGATPNQKPPEGVFVRASSG